jgi:DNA-binding transcriptional ArsR family regulator
MIERSGDGVPGTVTVERRSPEEAFALLGDDTRIGILRALGEVPDGAMSFSALRERVGTEDSGRFNYHLRKLQGTFVRKTDAGYELTYAGRQIVGAMYAGTYTANATIESTPVEGECPMCGGGLQYEYAEETVRMTCTDCEEWYNEFSFPPGGLDQFTPAELPLAFDRWMHHSVSGIIEGFCHTCAGRMHGEVVLDDDPDASRPAHVEYQCDRCGSTARTAGATPVHYHPAVEGFLFEHGIDPTEMPSWQVWNRIPRPDVEVVSRDPPTLAVTLAYEGERVVATVEADASVTDVRREQVD